MRISAINLINSYRPIINKPINNNNQSKFYIRNTRTLNCDTVSFAGKSINPLWDDFMAQYRQNYPKQRLEDTVYNMTSIKDNKLGEGKKKIVYSIDGIDDYVVARLKSKEEKRNEPFVGYRDPFPDQNFSQPIGGNNANFIIMRKIKGRTHGLKEWTARFIGFINDKIGINESDAKLFLSELEDIEQFPIYSYVDLARQVKYLNDRRLKMDMFNPNNILIDKKTKKISYFDLFDVDPSTFYPIKPETNCTQDMINILTDALLHAEYLAVLSDEDKSKLMTTTRNIAQKCHIAGKLVGLNNDSSISYQTFRIVQDSLTRKRGYSPDYVGLYEKYLKIYSKKI